MRLWVGQEKQSPELVANEGLVTTRVCLFGDQPLCMNPKLHSNVLFFRLQKQQQQQKKKKRDSLKPNLSDGPRWSMDIFVTLDCNSLQLLTLTSSLKLRALALPSSEPAVESHVELRCTSPIA